jgi:CheY-like chemotaxis protein
MEDIIVHRKIENILIIDDNETEVELLKRAFASNGLNIKLYSTSDGIETIKYLMGEGNYSDRNEFPYPSFIFCDLKMNYGNGFDVLEHIKANPAWAIIPIVILSSSEDPDDVRTAYLLGASSFIRKPTNAESLKNLVNTIINYWSFCLIPDTEKSGKQVITDSAGKLGEKFPQPMQDNQKRVVQ